VTDTWNSDTHRESRLSSVIMAAVAGLNEREIANALTDADYSSNVG